MKEVNVSLYQERLKLQNARFTRIEHEDALVATVFKVALRTGEELILKICSREGDYFREVYFLNHFADKLPVPRIIRLVEPEREVSAALLMECFSGQLLKVADLHPPLMHEMGVALARIHLEKVAGYGDLTQPGSLSSDPRLPFTLKFEEGLEECSSHLPTKVIEKCRQFFDRHVDSLISSDGPCIVHRDFRPGNVFAFEGKLQGIIDWSSARGGFAEEDFCPLEWGDWSNDLTLKSSFLEGYSSLRKVPAYHRIMPILKLSKSIATIGFTVKTGTLKSKNAALYQRHLQTLQSLL